LIRGKPKPVSIRQITTLQLKITTRKGCQVYMVHAEEDGKKIETKRINQLPIIREF